MAASPIEAQSAFQTSACRIWHSTSCRTMVSLQYPRYIIAAVPNGGFRNAKEAAIMKREGILAGFSDLIIIAEHNVLFLEVKTPDGRLSEKQKEFQRKVCALGFEYMVCRSFDESALAIERWLKVISMK